MDSMEVNKAIAAVLVAGIVFFLTGLIGVNLVNEQAAGKAGDRDPGRAGRVGRLRPRRSRRSCRRSRPLLAKADVATGETTVKKLCTVCHTFNEGGKAGVGPNLYGVVGGPARPYGRLQLLGRE